jgi:uncharacterized membrane protein HdeD (DUF308 family)
MAQALGVGLPADPETLRKFRIWFKIYGVLMILVGIGAILLPGIATLATGLFVGWFLIAAGVLGLISSFQAGTSSPGFWWNLLTSILCLLAGGILLVNPISGVLTLTVVLAAYLLATGVTKLVMAFGYKSSIPRAWGFVLFSAVVDIILGIIIVAGLPGTAVWVIGLMVGINLLFTGVALLVSAFTCLDPDKIEAAAPPPPTTATA